MKQINRLRKTRRVDQSGQQETVQSERHGDVARVPQRLVEHTVRVHRLEHGQQEPSGALPEVTLERHV